MDIEQIKLKLTPVQVLALTILHEAGNQGRAGMEAVANVIVNRVEEAPKYGKDLKGVCLKKWQFSCWLPEGGLANFKKLKENAEIILSGFPIGVGDNIQRAFGIAEDIIGLKVKDNTNGANHYLTQKLYNSDKRPAWAKTKKPIATIGDHVFFKL